MTIKTKRFLKKLLVIFKNAYSVESQSVYYI